VATPGRGWSIRTAGGIQLEGGLSAAEPIIRLSKEFSRREGCGEKWVFRSDGNRGSHRAERRGLPGEMGRTLVIKLGAMGDVLRTTAILSVLKGEVYWVTRAESLELVPKDRVIRGVFDVSEAARLARESFDLVLSFDDEYEGARLASVVGKRELIGSYVNGNESLVYTTSSAPWFDMGIISCLGKARADELKWRNRKTYQEIIFSLLGAPFTGQEYILNPGLCGRGEKAIVGLIGIERRAGERWPTKRWTRYEDLAALLMRGGYTVRFLEQREHLSEHVADIAACELIVCGDTLAMHLALALRKRVVTLFTCTSPHEICDYGRMVKVVSPLLHKAFYRQDFVPEAVEAISLDEVYGAVQACMEISG
jgi:heptosyltransferase-2